MYNPAEFEYYHRDDYGFLDYHFHQLLNFLEAHPAITNYQFTLDQLQRAYHLPLSSIEDINFFKKSSLLENPDEEKFGIVQLMGTIFFFYIIDCKEPKMEVIKNTTAYLFVSSPEFKKLYLDFWNATAS
ncbi:MAG TPA: hypothetical protein VF209_03875 [Patescibacteria group bacterium]